MLLKENGKITGEQSQTGFREMALIKDMSLGLDPAPNKHKGFS